jgi:hypothetical protein
VLPFNIAVIVAGWSSASEMVSVLSGDWIVRPRNILPLNIHGDRSLKFLVNLTHGGGLDSTFV